MGIHAVGNLKSAVDERGEWIYAWCVTCGHAKQHIERVCAAGAPAELSDWQCGGCKSEPEEAKKIKHCPNEECGVAIEKISGCNHMECSACEQHWCWYCGEKSTNEEIYGHMETEHGGYFAGEDEDFSDRD